MEKIKSWLFEKTNKIDKSRLNEEKLGGKTQIAKTDKRRDINTDPIDTKRIMRKYALAGMAQGLSASL